MQSYFYSDSTKIERVVFDDGTVWDSTVLDAAPILPPSTDTFNGTSGNDVIDLRNAANTYVSGPAGSGTNLGNDTYLWGAGSGQDSIYENDTTVGSIDTVKVIGVAPSEVTVTRSTSGVTPTNDLVISINGTTDTLTIQSYFFSDSYKIEGVQFDNGTVWTSTELNAAVINAQPTGNLIISGTAAQNQTVSVTNALGDTDGLGSMNYQWQSSLNGNAWSDVIGAVGSSFTLTEAQVGTQLRVRATYIDGHGVSETRISAATTVVANINFAPTGTVGVDGTATQGQALVASNTLADVDGLGTISYQWQSSTDGTTWAAIPGATGSSFTLTAAQVGQQVRVSASYTDGHGTAESVASIATAAIANTNANSAPTGTVGVGGTATQSEVLTASNTLADIDGLGTIGYQWQNSTDGTTWTAISGATASNFALTEAQVGQQVRVTASYTDSHGTNESVASTATVAVANVNDAPTGAVGVSGTATQGQTLTGSNTLADLDGLGTISYQWKADGIAIGGATASTLVLAEAQVGKAISVSASYIDGHGTTESISSSASTVVANINDAPTGTVGVGGTATQGQTLTATNTLDDLDGLGTISYQWKADGIAIGGATASTLVVAEAQVGKAISVSASYTDGHGTVESVTSGATAVVAAIANGNTTPSDPTFYGTTGNDTIDLRNAVNTTVSGPGGSATNAGNDTYLFGAGAGQDVISDSDSTAGNVDTIKVIGKLPTEVTLNRSLSGNTYGNDLLISLNGTTDKLTVANYFAASAYKVERVEFDNGTIWGVTELDAAPILPPSGATFYGMAGNDIIDLRNAANTTAYGNTANTDSGNDTYVFGAGAGQDIINEYGTTAGNVDTIKIVGQTPADVTLQRSVLATGYLSSDLVISINGSTDQLAIQNYYASDAYKIERVEFDDGTIWTAANFAGLPLLPTGALVYGTVGADVIDLRNSVATTAYGYSANTDSGNDTYVFGAGAGQDKISEYGTTAGNVDTIKIVGQTPADVTLARAVLSTGYLSSDLVISINGTTDTLTVQNYFASNPYKIEKVQFDDGTIWTAAEFDTLPLVPTGTLLYATNGAETIDLRNSANTLAYGYTSTASDSGNDTYIFGAGAGQDVVSDYGTAAGNIDLAKFAPGIAADQLWFRHVGNNLEVSVIGNSDKLTIQNWYASANYHIEQFKTADDKLLIDTRVETLVQAMATFAPPAAGETALPPAYQEALSPVIAANWQ
ncbi:MAG: calcium-binding protein [Sulfuritalea sp.]|nr:calcium-binding protein [Sulfuritalea sp.]